MNYLNNDFHPQNGLQPPPVADAASSNCRIDARPAEKVVNKTTAAEPGSVWGPEIVGAF